MNKKINPKRKTKDYKMPAHIKITTTAEFEAKYGKMLSDCDVIAEKDPLVTGWNHMKTSRGWK